MKNLDFGVSFLEIIIQQVRVRSLEFVFQVILTLLILGDYGGFVWVLDEESEIQEIKRFI